MWSKRFLAQFFCPEKFRKCLCCKGFRALAVPIVAFANADGGVIAIGVSDKTRKIEGIDQHTEKLNELLRVPFDFCNPSVPVTCSYLPCTDKDGNENRKEGCD